MRPQKRIPAEAIEAVKKITQTSVNMTHKQIIKKLKISSRMYYKILNLLNTSDKKIVVVEKKENMEINKLVSLHLLYHCNDLKILTQRIAFEILQKQTKKIFIPDRITKILDEKKIKKIDEIITNVGVKVSWLNYR